MKLERVVFVAVAALLCTSRYAWADVVMPPPDECMPGARPHTSHAGSFCVPNLCGQCQTGETCQEERFCIAEHPSGGRPRPEAAVVMVAEAVSRCDGSGICARGECRAISVCMPGAGGTGGAGGAGGAGAGGAGGGGAGMSTTTGGGAGVSVGGAGSGQGGASVGNGGAGASAGGASGAGPIASGGAGNSVSNAGGGGPSPGQGGLGPSTGGSPSTAGAGAAGTSKAPSEGVVGCGCRVAASKENGSLSIAWCVLAGLGLTAIIRRRGRAN